MSDQKRQQYNTNLLRFVSAELYALLSMNGARDLFARGYFQLSQPEKAAVDELVRAMVGDNYRALSQEYFESRPETRAGFQSQPQSSPIAQPDQKDDAKP